MSKELEALGCLKDLKAMCGTKIELDKFPEYHIVEQSLIKAQETEKENAEYKRVLKIIKTRNVDLSFFIYYCNTNVDGYNRYIHSGDFCKRENLTQEEFELLKRYFGNE